MKKILGIVMIIAMVFAFAGCAKEEESVEVVNPVHECTQEELVQATGINLEAPNGSDTIQYRYYDGDNMIAEAEFTFNGVTYVYRAQSTDATDIKTGVDGTVVDADKLADAAKEGNNIGILLAGDYYEWDECKQMDFQGRDAIYVQVNDGPAVMTWLDVVPGFVYSMSMDKDASEAQLVEMAESCFVPMQGEV